MKTKRTWGWAAVLISLFVTPGYAQVTDEFSGVWRVTAATSTRRERDGSLTVLKEGELALTLRLDGDSVSGVWAAKDLGPDGRDLDVSGRIDGNIVTFTTPPFSRSITVNGEEQDVWMTVSWRAELVESRLVGSRWMTWSGQGRRPIMIPWWGEKSGKGG